MIEVDATVQLARVIGETITALLILGVFLAIVLWGNR